ncbi:MAG: hypothetical protein IKR99_04470 [Lachnospiraceae bacterium]|nr:hypothetical protein [Lachnospiraceae bacterium]
MAAILAAVRVAEILAVAALAEAVCVFLADVLVLSLTVSCDATGFVTTFRITLVGFSSGLTGVFLAAAGFACVFGAVVFLIILVSDISGPASSTGKTTF